eukprot:scaffold172849_cov18-Tisochrysis_lutea.AAC.1
MASLPSELFHEECARNTQEQLTPSRSDALRLGEHKTQMSAVLVLLFPKLPQARTGNLNFLVDLGKQTTLRACRLCNKTPHKPSSPPAFQQAGASSLLLDPG